MSLPPVIRLETMPGVDTAEKWKVYLERIYDIFCRDVAGGRLRFQGLPIRCRYHEPYQGKHASFWRMMSEGAVESERTPDLERCARIPWIGWVIRHADDSTFVRWWQHERATKHGRKTRVPLWLFEHDYAVILEPRADYCLLVMSYCVRPDQKLMFEKEWAAWKAKNGRGRV